MCHGDALTQGPSILRIAGFLSGGNMQKVNIGIIGTGWCGGIRAETCAASPYVSELHIAEIHEAQMKEVADKTKPATATTDYRALLNNADINSIIISATPETLHYPMAKETLLAGKHLLL